MPSVKAFAYLLILALFWNCKSKQQQLEGIQPSGDIIATSDFPKTVTPKKSERPKGMPAIPDTTFVDLKNYSTDFVYDIKYATTDNFLKSQVYECPECFLRLKTVQALMQANQDFLKLGFRIKIFDCYRPLDIQKKMWKIVSNPDYVANPAKGSIHNRGGAVDITLVDSAGKELDMGTAFDHFGPEAAVDYVNLSEEVKKNRKLLQTVMSANGFTVLRSEWWHFNLNGASNYKISNEKWDCR